MHYISKCITLISHHLELLVVADINITLSRVAGDLRY